MTLGYAPVVQSIAGTSPEYGGLQGGYTLELVQQNTTFPKIQLVTKDVCSFTIWPPSCGIPISSFKTPLKFLIAGSFCKFPSDVLVFICIVCEALCDVFLCSVNSELSLSLCIG